MSSTNFIGRDPMQGWIGQVTDPDKGEWGDCLEKQQADDGEDINAFRCRVRIVGYHGNDVDLPDEDLPLAHVLLPHELEEYVEHHKDEIEAGDHHDPNALELFCDQNPEEPECLVYDD